MGLAEADGSDGGSEPAAEYTWSTCADGKVRFVKPEGWRLEEEDVSDGVVRCTLVPESAEDGPPGGSVTIQHWFRWPPGAGVQPAEYAASAIQRLERGRRMVDQLSTAKGTSLIHRAEVVDLAGEPPMHRWVLFVAHSEIATLDRVSAVWPESSWEEVWEVIQPTLASLELADQGK
jgi:hypothetical protein